MQLKRIYETAAASLLAMAALTACDDVSPENRYEQLPAVEASRSVLLVDFTGQNCVNCPEAHKVIEQLEEQYGRDKVVAVSVHSGSFGIAVKRTDFNAARVGLMTEEGNTIMTSYGIQSFPMGVIDGGSPETYDQWPSSVRTALEQPAGVSIELEANYVASDDGEADGTTGTLEMKASLMASEALSGHLQFWITENGIVAQQRNLTETVPNYVHNNVFRAQAFNGADGRELNLQSGIGTEVEASIGVRYTDKERWNAANLEVVCFVSDAKGRVMQVKRVPVSQ